MKVLIAILLVDVCVMGYVLYIFNRWLHRLFNVVNRYEKLIGDLFKALKEVEK